MKTIQHHILPITCFILFVVHSSIVGWQELFPSETFTNVKEKKLDEIEFPAVFKICIYPSANMTELAKVGYKDIWNYFIGRSSLNKNIFGWAGHTPEGTEIASVEGDIKVKTMKSRIKVCTLRNQEEDSY